MRSGLARAERGGVHSLSTDCGLDLDGPITVSPYDPPPAVHGGSRRLAGGGEPTRSRAPPRTHLPPPKSAYGTSSPSRGGRRSEPTVPSPPAAVTTQSRSGQQVKGAGSHQDTLTPTRRYPNRGREGAPRGEAGGRGGGARTLLPWATG